MRSFLRAWDNRPPRGQPKPLVNGRTWTRRVRWYQGPTIRLEFYDEGEVADAIYTSREEADAAYEAFIEGRLVVEDGQVLDAVEVDTHEVDA